jgi:hypothetical protein
MQRYYCCKLQVKEDDLEEVLKACPDDKRADLIFLQEGCTEPLLKRYGVCRKDQVLHALSIAPQC